jgi:ribosomal protein L23
MTIDRLPETKYETLKETANFDRINLDKFIGKKASYKKAYVKLKAGETISDLFN